MPILGGPSNFGTISLRALPGRLQELQRLAAEAGRGRIPVTVYGAPPERWAIERLQAAGVDRCLFLIPSAPAHETLKELERCATVAIAFP
jgi:hypothetical protein